MAEREKLELKDVVRDALAEARMVLPGIQALFGFQLVAAFNASFKEIPMLDHYLHLAALILTICSVGCLMAPASYHRQVERDEVSTEFEKYASNLICLGMVPLMLSITLDTYVVANLIASSTACAVAASAFAFLFLATLWYVVPGIKRASNAHKKESSGAHRTRDYYQAAVSENLQNDSPIANAGRIK